VGEPGHHQVGYTKVAGPGQPVTYTLVYSNVGSAIASGVVISDVAPAELDEVRFESSRLVTATGSFSYTWWVGDLAPAERGVITLTGRIRPDLEGTHVFANRAAIHSMGSETDPGDNHASAVVRVSPMRFYLPLARTGWQGQ